MQLDLPTLKTLGAGFINLGIFTAIVYKAGKKPFLESVTTRSNTLREQIQEAARQLDAAQAQYHEYKARLASIDAEVSALRTQNQQDVVTVAQRLRESAGKQAQQIVSEARMARDAAISAAKARLALEAGAQVIERAEALIKGRITGDEKAKIRREFSNQLEQIR
jgi:F0F1-type ATP synthase membrane subunit b/b'